MEKVAMQCVTVEDIQKFCVLFEVKEDSIKFTPKNPPYLTLDRITISIASTKKDLLAGLIKEKIIIFTDQSSKQNKDIITGKIAFVNRELLEEKVAKLPEKKDTTLTQGTVQPKQEVQMPSGKSNVGGNIPTKQTALLPGGWRTTYPQKDRGAPGNNLLPR